MSAEIRPALSPEEWAKRALSRAGCVIVARPNQPWVSLDDGEGSVDVGYEDRHALAALALYGEPFGFTKHDAHALRNVERVLGERWAGDLATRIEALLPPDPHA